MLNTNLQLLPINTNQVEQNATKASVFQILNYYFALPLEAIIKIITCPPIVSPIREGLGLVEWDRQTITVIDLADKLQANHTESILNTNSGRFLILTQTTSAELCGFLIKCSPLLIDIPWNTIRSVPLSYRQVADLSVIKQMAILPRSTLRFQERAVPNSDRQDAPESTVTLKIFLLGEWYKIS